MTDMLARLLLEISSALLVPIILLLLYFLSVTLLQAGGLVAEAWSRSSGRSAWLALLRHLKRDAKAVPSPDSLAITFGLPAIALRELAEFPSATDKILDDMQLRAERLLGPLSLGVRVGPMLGLAGTLIPLGPALVALSQGNIQSLSSKLVVAFATTVIGLLIGGVCYAVRLLRNRWYTQDLNDIEFVARRLSHASNPSSD